MLQLLTVLKTAELISATVTFSYSESLKLEGFTQVQPVRWDSNAGTVHLQPQPAPPRARGAHQQQDCSINSSTEQRPVCIRSTSIGWFLCPSGIPALCRMYPHVKQGKGQMAELGPLQQPLNGRRKSWGNRAHSSHLSTAHTLPASGNQLQGLSEPQGASKPSC